MMLLSAREGLRFLPGDPSSGLLIPQRSSRGLSVRGPETRHDWRRASQLVMRSAVAKEVSDAADQISLRSASIFGATLVFH